MSEMAPEGGATGAASGVMGGKIMGIPSIVWIGGIAIIVYFLFFRNANKTSGSGASAGTTTGGSGTINTGATTIDSGAVQVTVQGANASPNSAESTAASGTGNASSQSQPNPPTTGTTTTTSGAPDLAAPGGNSDTPYNNFVDLGWGPVSGAQQYHYQVLQGNKVVADSLTSSTHARASGLSPNTAYKWRVSVGQPRGKWGSFINFRTKA